VQSPDARSVPEPCHGGRDESWAGQTRGSGRDDCANEARRAASCGV